MTHEETIQRNLDWFMNSGILEPEGHGVYERVWLLPQDHPLVNGNKLWENNIFTYRRVDCALETAIAFALAHKVFGKEDYQWIARNMVSFVNNEGFQEMDPKSPDFGLYAHGMTRADAVPKDNPFVKTRGNKTFWNKKWVDDNAWAVMAQIYLARQFPEIGQEALVSALVAAEALLEKKDLLNSYCRNAMDVPHWGGMRAMALAQAFDATKDERFASAALDAIESQESALERYIYAIIPFAGQRLPKPGEIEGEIPKPFDLSNAGYALMQLSSVLNVARRNRNTCDDPAFISDKGLPALVEYILSRQHPDGHLPGEWWEGSAGEDVADLVYGMNWITNGLQMVSGGYSREFWRNPDNAKGKKAIVQRKDLALNFLAQAQIQSDNPLTNGAWQGAYKVSLEQGVQFPFISIVPGGEDRKEGGPSCIYSGWTNAPIATAYLHELSGMPHPYLGQVATGKNGVGTLTRDQVQDAHKIARALYEEHKSKRTSSS